MNRTLIKTGFLTLASGFSLAMGQQPPLNPQITEIVSQVSAERIANIQKKLESFGTRNIYSATDDPQHGIGGAREWIAGQLKEYSPKLEVSFDKHRVAKQGRAFKKCRNLETSSRCSKARASRNSR